jgi:carbon-monoxide dehydrogenase medium subunit
MIGSFDHRVPTTLDEAFALLERYGDDARPIAGGTALVILMKQRLVRPAVLVSLRKINGLRGIDKRDAGLRVSAMTSHREAETSPLVRAHAPLLAEALRHVATIRIRNVATLGGNLAHADPNQDPPVALIALGAKVILSGKDGVRTLDLDEFFSDYYETVLQRDELITSILIPESPPGIGAAFLKFLPRSMEDYATISAAATVQLDPDGEVCAAARVAVGSAAAVPVRARGVEAAVLGQSPTGDVLAEAAAEVRHEIDPIPDARGTAEYKSDMAQVFVKRALSDAFTDARSKLMRG